MSNEFVMVPRVPTDEMKEAADGLGFVFSHGDEEWNGIISADMAEEIYQVMIDAKPAEQHQGEPVALPEQATDTESCSALMKRIGLYGSVNVWHGGRIWNACLDEIAKLGPLYTRADPGEVERLRLLLGQARSMVNGATDEWHKSVAEALKND